MRKLISLVLVASLLFAVSGTSLAADKSELNSQTFVLDGTTIRIEINDSKDMCEFLEYHDGIYFGSSIVNKNTGEIKTTTIINGKQETSFELVPKASDVITPKRAAHLGKILYGTELSGQKEITVSYDARNGYSNYNINGTYQMVAQLASRLVALFGMPGWIANQTANWIVYALGLASANFVIPNKYVGCNTHNVSYYLTGSDGRSNFMNGIKYTYTLDGQTKSFEEGAYYDPQYAWHNDTFGRHVFRSLYGDASFWIILWARQ